MGQINRVHYSMCPECGHNSSLHRREAHTTHYHPQKCEFGAKIDYSWDSKTYADDCYDCTCELSQEELKELDPRICYMCGGRNPDKDAGWSNKDEKRWEHSDPYYCIDELGDKVARLEAAIFGRRAAVRDIKNKNKED